MLKQGLCFSTPHKLNISTRCVYFKFMIKDVEYNRSIILYGHRITDLIRGWYVVCDCARMRALKQLGVARRAPLSLDPTPMQNRSTVCILY